MISPDSIPRIAGDMTELAAHANELTRTGAAIADTGATVHQGWQALAAVYQAPEADQLLAATGPVMAVCASVGEDIQAAAAALRVYAADTADIQARLDALRLQAADLVTAYAAAQDEPTTITLDDRSAGISVAVASQIAAWEAAQLRCANAVRALTGTPPLAGPTTAMTLVEVGGGLNITPRGPTGSLREIFPIDQAPPISSTGNPPFVLGTGVLVNVPAPPPATVVDGPGSFQPGFVLGRYLDTATDGAGGGAAGGRPTGGTEPASDEDFVGTGFSRDEVAEFIRGHTDDNNPAMDDRPSITEIREALDPKNVTADDGRAVTYEHGDTRVIVNRGNVFRSTAYYPRGR